MGETSRVGKLTALALLLGVGGVAAGPARAAEPTVMDRLDLDSYRGKYLILHFWSAGCELCNAQLPSLRRLVDEVKDSGAVEVMGVYMERDRGGMERYLAEDPVPWPQVFDGLGPGSPLVKRFEKKMKFSHDLLLGPDGEVITHNVGLIRKELGRRLNLVLEASTGRGGSGIIRGTLVFDGVPIAALTPVKPDLDIEEMGKIGFGGLKVDWSWWGSTYEIRGLPVGTYALSFWLDANPGGPAGSSGDFHSFRIEYLEVQRPGDVVQKDLHLFRSMRLREPFDSDTRPLSHDGDPLPRHASPVTFAWDPMPEVERYGCRIDRVQEDPWDSDTVMTERMTQNRCRVDLPPSKDWEHYKVEISAYKGSEAIGVFSQYYGFVVLPSSHDPDLGNRTLPDRR